MTDDAHGEQPADAELSENAEQAPGMSDSDAGEVAVDVEENAAEMEQPQEENAPSEADPDVAAESSLPEEEAEDAMLKMLKDLPAEEKQITADDINFGAAEVSDAEFQHLQEPAGESEPQNIDLLMDVDLPISIELGRTKMSISDILALGPGSVVELNKLAGEPVDLLVNSKTVAKGEVVVVEENFGLRITQLMTPEERLKALAEE